MAQNKTKVKEDKVQNIFQALLQFQREHFVVHKDSKNPYHNNQYASLESVIETVIKANKFDVFFYQSMEYQTKADGNVVPYINTVACHAPSETKIESRTLIIIKDPTNPQAMGSGITYAKRYGLMALFGLPSADDDGNEASNTRSGKGKPNPKTEPKSNVTNITNKTKTSTVGDL